MGAEVMFFILGGIAGVVIGYFVARSGVSANNEVIDKLKAELEGVKEKLKTQTEHFTESENLLHRLGTDLKDLYQHMSKNEISTLKEKFKGLVIDADAKVDEIAHKAKEAGNKVKDAVEHAHETAKEEVAAAKEKSEDVKKAAQDKIEQAQVAIDDAQKDAKAHAEQTIEQAKEKASDVKDATKDATQTAKDHISDAKDAVVETAHDAKDKVKNAVK